MKIHLLVMSKKQELLDGFINTLYSTTDPKNFMVHAHINDKLKLEESDSIKRYSMNKLEPHVAFNKSLKHINRDLGNFIAVVNDDIIFSEGWYEDVEELLKCYYVVSPGFVDTRNKNKFQICVDKTKNKEGVYEDMVDSFYIFPAFLINHIGEFDESVCEWWDVDFRIRLDNHNIQPVTSKKITVMHIYRQTLTKDIKLDYKNKVRNEVIEKHGRMGLHMAREYPRRVRRAFKEDGSWSSKKRRVTP